MLPVCCELLHDFALFNCRLLMQDARKAFRQAQGKMHSCRQAFHNAQAAGDSAQQRHWASQLEYWQQQALQEKKAAHKTIFSKK